MKLFSATKRSHTLEQKNLQEMVAIASAQSFITISENHENCYIEVELRGPFPSPEEVTKELSMLRKLTNTYETVCVFINSVGGSADTMIELLNIVDMFDTIITINMGNACSAGFILWCAGDVRVVANHSSFLAHRESYVSVGQTSSHISRAEFNERTFSKLFEEYCGDILTEEEFNLAKVSDALLSADDLLEREVCISLDQYNTAVNYQSEQTSYLVEKNGVMGLFNQDGTVNIVEELLINDLALTPLQFALMTPNILTPAEEKDIFSEEEEEEELIDPIEGQEEEDTSTDTEER